MLTFSTTAEGQRFNPVWGLDQAWISEQNVRKGINHMGSENIGIGRIAFRTTDALTGDTALTSKQIATLRERVNLFNLVNRQLPLTLTADQEAGTASYYLTGGKAHANRWAALINAHVAWLKKNTQHPVAGISPFNEPDYWTKEEGATPALQQTVAQLLKSEYPQCADVAIVGGNTLNNDKALAWYTVGKDYYDWGNTHQLAGGFDTFADFYQQLAADGKVGYADEMHNVGEAMVGLEYGMTTGIWWGFDSRARGEFCDISRHGRRLAYGENRPAWTAASVYQHDNGRVKAFLGSSERQAVTSSFLFLSLDREVYYDGQGPLREIRMELPGGNKGSYQNGQTNAERVVNVEWGEDVPPAPVNGTYIIMNKYSRCVVTAGGTMNGQVNIQQQTYSKSKNQQWNISPISSRIGGDYSFYDIASVADGKRMDVLNFSTAAGANVIAYGNATPSSNQQWYLEYAGDGCYYIRNRESALYLTLDSRSTASGINIVQNTLYTVSMNRDRQLWRIIPADAQCETEAPAQPKGLTATPQSHSVRLTWEANSESDLDGYMLLRADQADGQWNTIARRLSATTFIDNNCRTGHTYQYKLKAIDYSCNLSEASDVVVAAPSEAQPLVAHWQLNSNLLDDTENALHAAFQGKATYTAGPTEGTQALSLNGTSGFLQLPYEVAANRELTVALWAYWRGGAAQQRLFDFGNGTDAYISLTPSDNNHMQLTLKNGPDEQTLDCPTWLDRYSWQHVAVTLDAQGQAAIYVNGQPVAQATGLTISPADIHPLLNYVGRGQDPAVPLYRGYVADFRVYSRALAADEVAALHGTTSRVVAPAATTDDAPAYSLSGQLLPAQAQRPGISVSKGKKNIRK